MLKLRVFIWRYRQTKQYYQAISETRELHQYYTKLLEQEGRVEKFKRVLEQQIQKYKIASIQMYSDTLPHLPKIEKKHLLEFLQLYNQSIQSLLEGKRDTVTNSQFKFKDGETIDEKIQRIEQKFKNILGKSQ